jgi:hypothetical protein
VKLWLCMLAITAAGGDRLSLGDMDLWKSIGTAEWHLEDGVINGGQDGDPKRAGRLVSRAKFADFEMELEFRIDEHGKYNSGVYIRKGYQVNIGRGAAGEYVGLYSDRWLDTGDEKDTIRKPNAWNHLRIRAVGPRIQVWLNRQQIVDYTEADPSPAQLGGNVIALQTYGAEGHAGWVKFRDLWITDLSDTLQVSKAIGKHTLARPEAGWPESVHLRLYLKGLEALNVAVGDQRLELSVLSHGNHRQLQSIRRAGKETALPADSPLRASITRLDDFFDVRIPQAVYASNPDAIELSWIDFYRR